MSALKSFFARTDEEIRTSRILELLKKEESNASKTTTKKRKHVVDEDNQTIQVVEVVDMEKLNLIYQHRRKLFESLDQGQKTLFNNFYTNTLKENGRRVVIYQQKSGSDNFGRFSPKNGVSLQNIRKEIRNTIACDLYWQLDITNAHPWILLSLAKQMKWETPHLVHYVNNREKVLSELEVPFADAKRAILIIMYGGNASKEIGKPLSKFAAMFRAELVEIAKKIFASNTNLVKRLKVEELDEHKRVYSFLSRVLQHNEARCLVAAHNFLTANGWHTGALLHDGLLVLKRADGAVIDSAMLSALTEHIDKTENLQNIKFQLKEMDNGYDFSKFGKSDETENSN